MKQAQPAVSAQRRHIRTRSPVIDGHGDITNPRLLDLPRQLYLDSDGSERQRGRLQPQR